MITDEIFKRHSGELSRHSVTNKTAYRRRLSLEFSQQKVLKSVHTGGVTWLDLDLVEQRYLLTGAADSSVAVYDTQAPPSSPKGEVEAVLHISRQSPGAHKYSVSCLAWYPVDTGLFVTGGYDNEVKVWDTNTLTVAASFGLSGRVHGLAMSPCATSHCLVAVGSAEPQVMLCDVASGAFTHTLTGHKGPVWSIHWSLQSEWHVVTGGCDGQLRLWDIRRPGPLHIFDQHHTQRTELSTHSTTQTTTAPRVGLRPAGGRGRCPSSRTSTGGSGGGAEHRRNGSRGSSARASGAGGGSPKGGVSRGPPPPLGLGSPSERMHLPERVSKFASAHGGSITGVCPTPHGLFWVSAGTDDRVRLWDAATYRNLLVNFPGAYNRSLRARQLSVTEDSRVLFHPSGSAVQMYDLESGATLRVLQGVHFDTVNCCKWNPLAEELYTGSSDCHIIAWAPPSDAAREGGEGEASDSDQDNWSD